jgi:hypothetical protein
MAAATAALGFAAAPASAQVTGTLNLTGVVTGVCSVQAGPAGFTTGSFSSTYTFTPMTDGTGHLNAATFGVASGATAGNPVQVSAEVMCNTGAPKVALLVEPLSQGDVGSGASSVSGTIDFTGEADIVTGAGTTKIIKSTAGSTPGVGATVPAAAMPAALAIVNPNVTLYAYTFATRNGPLLEPGTYNGEVQVTITPN